MPKKVYCQRDPSIATLTTAFGLIQEQAEASQKRRRSQLKARGLRETADLQRETERYRAVLNERLQKFAREANPGETSQPVPVNPSDSERAAELERAAKQARIAQLRKRGQIEDQRPQRKLERVRRKYRRLRARQLERVMASESMRVPGRRRPTSGRRKLAGDSQS